MEEKPASRCGTCRRLGARHEGRHVGAELFRTMYVTVVGGGNSTPIFAALAADAGHEVAILTRKPAQWNAADIGFVNDDLGW